MPITPDDSDWTFIRTVFSRFVPEIASGIVEIRAVARIPGVRTKVAFASLDPTLDCIRVCLGERNSRINDIVADLGGTEKIDLIPWTDSPERFVSLALCPGAAGTVSVDLATHTAVATVLPSDLALTLGTGGHNRELASRLTGWNIAIVVQEDAA